MEEQDVSLELENLLLVEANATIDLEEARSELEAILSGAALDEVDEELRRAGGASRAKELAESIEAKRIELERVGFWTGLSGRRTQLEREVSDLEREAQRIEEFRRRALLLRGDSSVACRPIEDRLKKADARVAELRSNRTALEGRLVELAVMGTAGNAAQPPI